MDKIKIFQMTQENHLKAILNKYVLRTDLKTLKDCLISEGREFQSFGAQDEKARSPIDHRRVGGITKRPESEERRS